MNSNDTNNKTNQAFFSPGDDCLNHIIELINNAKTHLDICVFTISDDRISRALLRAKHFGVELKIITDNDKLLDTGSDIKSLSNEGIPVKVDNTPNHMHHKFMIVDREIILTGSYNWTRSAAMYNQENVLSTNDKFLVNKFSEEFNKLWLACDKF